MVSPMPTSNGSAASATRALPQSAVRGAVSRCCKHLRHAADLAELAAAGPEPEIAADHLVGAVAELRGDLAVLRAYLSQHPL